MADHLARLAGIMNCPGAVDALDALTEGTYTFAGLSKAARVPRRRLEPALRALAAEGAIRRSGPGSWDGKAARDTRYALTATGYRLVAELSDIDVWTAFYERHLNGRRRA